MGRQKNIKNIFKHQYPFKLESESWSESTLEFPNYYEVYETKEIKPEGCVQNFIKGILPFISYLKSSNYIKKVKGPRCVYSTYDMIIFKKNSIWGAAINVCHNGLKFIINYYCKRTRSVLLPKEYLRIRLCVRHHYIPMEIKKI